MTPSLFSDFSVPKASLAVLIHLINFVQDTYYYPLSRALYFQLLSLASVFVGSPLKAPIRVVPLFRLYLPVKD